MKRWVPFCLAVKGFGSRASQENKAAAGNPAGGMPRNLNRRSPQDRGTRIDGISERCTSVPNHVADVTPSDGTENFKSAITLVNAEPCGAIGAALNIQLLTVNGKFHGYTHGFHAGDNFNPLSTFNSATSERTILIFSQYGKPVGGPILKNELFFFSDREATLRVNSGGKPVQI